MLTLGKLCSAWWRCAVTDPQTQSRKCFRVITHTSFCTVGALAGDFSKIAACVLAWVKVGCHMEYWWAAQKYTASHFCCIATWENIFIFHMSQLHLYFVISRILFTNYSLYYLTVLGGFNHTVQKKTKNAVFLWQKFWPPHGSGRVFPRSTSCICLLCAQHIKPNPLCLLFIFSTDFEII